MLRNVLYNALYSYRKHIFFERTIIINVECPVLRMVVVQMSPPLLAIALSLRGQLFKDICTIMGHMGRERTGGVVRES